MRVHERLGLHRVQSRFGLLLDGLLRLQWVGRLRIRVLGWLLPGLQLQLLREERVARPERFQRLPERLLDTVGDPGRSMRERVLRLELLLQPGRSAG